ncbi:TPA: hypothetical protein ACK2W2_001631 [Klebsiella michiganensis]|nr:hypothetical protein [Citrobacter freundii]QLO06656.1 hypothetical protein HV141_24425 [Citrobacter freundii]
MMMLLFSIYCSLVIIAGAFFSWFHRETIATRCILFGGLVIVAAIKLTTDFTTVAVSTVLIDGLLLTAFIIAVRFVQRVVNRAG